MTVAALLALAVACAVVCRRARRARTAREDGLASHRLTLGPPPVGQMSKEWCERQRTGGHHA